MAIRLCRDKNNTFICTYLYSNPGQCKVYKIPCTFWGWGVLFLLLRLSVTRKRLVTLKDVWRGQNWFGILKITHSDVFKDSFLSAAEKLCRWPTSSQRCRAWRYGVRRVSWVIWRQERWWKTTGTAFKECYLEYMHGARSRCCTWQITSSW